MEKQKKVASIRWEPEDSYFTYIVYRNGTVQNYNTGNFVGCFNDRGYKYTSYTLLDGRRKQIYIARLVAMLYLHNPNNRKQATHKNGNKSDCSVENVQWATNSLYAEKNKRIWQGKGKRFNTHLTDKDVRAIRSSVWSAKRIAFKFDISRATVYQIKNGRTFKWVK